MKKIIFMFLLHSLCIFSTLAQDEFARQYVLPQDEMNSVIHAITVDGDLVYGKSDFSYTEASKRMLVVSTTLIEGTEYELEEVEIDGQRTFLMEDDLVLLLEKGNEGNRPSEVAARAEAREKAEKAAAREVTKAVAKAIAKATTKAVGTVFSTMDSISGDSCKTCGKSKPAPTKSETPKPEVCSRVTPTPHPSSKGREWRGRP
ncbi:MAG: hypothetical protein HQK51_09845 [Oligoflexia bacterium]|nr:hypothetical protein [Oligoflexia bacterium]